MNSNGNAAVCNRQGEGTTLRAVVCLLLAGLSAVPGQGRAEDAPEMNKALNLSLPAGSLAAALNRLAESSGLHLVYDASLAHGLSTQGLRGSYTVEQALQKLLQGTGVSYRVSGNHTVTLEKPATVQPDEGAALGKVTVTANTGDASPGYAVPQASTATKTDVPLLETPISIQVVSRAVMDDQQAIRLDDATKNAAGVQTMRQLGDLYDNFILRGFGSADFNVYRDGLRLGLQSFETANLERVEILKGPAATLYGRGSPGGLVNMVTKKPSADAHYALTQQFGSYGLYRTALDATGPVTGNGDLAYRLNFVYLDKGSFRDFVDSGRIFVAPQLTWRPTDATEFNWGFEYKKDNMTGDRGIPAVGNRPAAVPISRFIGEPDFSLNQAESYLAHFNWSHRFNENWKIRQRFAANILDTFNRNIVPLSLQANNRLVNRGLFSGLTERETYATDINLNGKFDIFDIEHNVLFGFDYLRFESNRKATFLAAAPFLTPIDIYNPVYGTVSVPDNLNPNNFLSGRDEWFGLYFQDQVDFTHGFHFLFSGRHDWARTWSGFSNTSGPELSAVSTQKFSPRVGLVFQPAEWLSIYSNWTQSLGANNGQSATGAPFAPEQSEQFEGGIKLEFFDGRLKSTLAVYDLTKTNILTADISTVSQTDQVAIGKARSQGIEFDVTGRITDKLSVIGSYAYTDTKVLKDDGGNRGNRLPNVPEHSGSLWANYEIVEGLKVGSGAYVAGQRQANTANSFQLPGYVRWDAMAAHEWKVGGSNITAQVNVNNILGKRYFTYADQFGNPQFDAMPADPRTVLGSIRVDY